MVKGRAPIIITGSSGFIGRAMCAAFVQDGYRVIGFDRPDGREPPERVTNIPCDVTSEPSVSSPG